MTCDAQVLPYDISIRTPIRAPLHYLVFLDRHDRFRPLFQMWQLKSEMWNIFFVWTSSVLYGASLHLLILLSQSNLRAGSSSLFVIRSCHIWIVTPPVNNRVPSRFHDNELMCESAWSDPVCTHLIERIGRNSRCILWFWIKWFVYRYSSACAGEDELWINGVGSKMHTLSS